MPQFLRRSSRDLFSVLRIRDYWKKNGYPAYVDILTWREVWLRERVRLIDVTHEKKGARLLIVSFDWNERSWIGVSLFWEIIGRVEEASCTNRVFVCPLIYYPIIYFVLGLTILPISSNFKKRIRRIFPRMQRELYLTYFIVVFSAENNSN